MARAVINCIWLAWAETYPPVEASSGQEQYMSSDVPPRHVGAKDSSNLGPVALTSDVPHKASSGQGQYLSSDITASRGM